MSGYLRYPMCNDRPTKIPEGQCMCPYVTIKEIR